MATSNMIKNRRQRVIAAKKLAELEATRDSLGSQDKSSWRAYTDLIDELNGEIGYFDDISQGRISNFDLNSLDDLGDALIKVRIFKQMTQADLAQTLGVSEQSVQKDESRSYENAGLARLAELIDELDYEFVGELRPRGSRSFYGDDGTSVSNAPRADIHFTTGPTAQWNASTLSTSRSRSLSSLASSAESRSRG